MAAREIYLVFLGSICSRFHPSGVINYMKTCRNCKEKKNLRDFHKDTCQVDGLYPLCKICVKYKNKKRRSERVAREVIVPETKICFCCREEKPNSDFSKDGSRLDFLRPYCRKCDVKKTFDRHKEKREFLMNFKESSGCKHCGITDPRCLEFHHLDPSQKEFHVTTKLYKSIEEIMEEAKKCIVLCCNCHRILHYGDKGRNDTRPIDFGD